MLFFFFKQKTAYEMRISDWSSDVCSSDLLDLVPRALVHRLFLTPDQIGGCRITLDLLDQQWPWERVQLLDADDRHIIDAALLCFFDQIKIYLARTGHDAFDLLRVAGGAVGNPGLEAALGWLGQLLSRPMVVKQSLG